MLKIIISVLNICLVMKFASGDLDSTFHRCCSLGQNKTLDPLKCESKIRTPVVGVAIEEQSLCLSTVELCCIQTLRNASCKNGKQAAKNGHSCTTDFRSDEDLSFRYCCEACKVGIIAGSMSMCSLKTFQFDSPWSQIYKSCCEELISVPNNSLPVTVSESANVCDLFPGELCHHICIPVNGSYRCQCRFGFSLLADGKSCREEVGNRCDRNNPCDQRCFDNGSSVECSCNSGFILLPDRISCEDIDECKDGTHTCNTQTHSCINHAGSYRCEPKEVKTVPLGFRIDPITNETVDLDECSRKPCKLNETCFNTIGSFKCECLKGFSLNAVTSSCIDINECTTGLHNCNALSSCVNTVGSYQCVPKTNFNTISPSPVYQNIVGFTYDAKTNRMVDINECDNNPCNSYEVCSNNIGSYTCTCARGFTRDRVTDACVDINECQTKKHDCDSDSQRCDNTIGSYQCVRVVSCGTGYTFNSQSGRCEDDDECVLETHNCHTLGSDYECKNLAGSFRCIPKKKCTNSQICGHFSVQKCSPGFILIDGKCADVNECSSGNLCPQGYSCQNTPGSFRCSPSVRTVCNNGLRLDEITNRCVDIDECIEQPNICDHKCTNSFGSFVCSCHPGYSLHEDKRSCIDINECEAYKHRRLCVFSCLNQPGSYTCTCPEGYRLGSDGASCIDIDECVDQNKCTNPNEICMNIRGTYRCNTITCPENYVQDTNRKNRCSRAPYLCQFNDETCTKMPQSYSFNYITFVSNVPVPSLGHIPLFNMRGSANGVSSITFYLELKSVTAPFGVPKATLDYFHLNQTSSNSVTVLLVKSITGPQDIELNLIMQIHFNGVYSGFTVSKLFIFVSQYEF